MLEHRGRNLAFGRTGLWRLTNDRLEQVFEGRQAVAVPLDRIESIYLAHDPAYRGTYHRYRCDIVRHGGQSIVIPSLHERPLGRGEDGAATYVPLIHALVAAVAARNPGCRFRQGRRQPLALLMASLGVGAALFAWALGDFAGMTGDDLHGFALAALAFGSLAGLPHAWKQWPRRFSPGEIPPKVLPPLD